MVSSLNDLDRMAMARARQAEVERRSTQKLEGERQQSKAGATTSEIKRKAEVLLHYLGRRGGPDAVIVSVADSVPREEGAAPSQEKAAWILFRQGGEWQDIWYDGVEYYLLADGRFVRCDILSPSQGSARWGHVVYPNCEGPGVERNIMDALERLIGKYS